MARLVHEGPAELPRPTPRSLIVVLLGPRPKDVYVDHVDTPEAALLNSSLEQLQRGIAAILFDNEQANRRLVAGFDHLDAVLPPGRHRLLSHHVAAGVSRLDRLLRMHAAGCSEHYDVGRRGPQHGGERLVSPRSSSRRRLLERGGVSVADVDQLGAIGVLLDCAEVIDCDTTAAGQREADLPIENRGWEVAHGVYPRL